MFGQQAQPAFGSFGVATPQQAQTFGSVFGGFGAAPTATASFSFGTPSIDNPFAVAPAKKATQTGSTVPVAAHFRTELHNAAPPAEFVEALEKSRCYPLDAESEIALREKAEESEPPAEIAALVDEEDEPASSADNQVVILDLTSSPPRQVDSIQAFGLVWAPIRSGFVRRANEQIRRATEAADAEAKRNAAANASALGESKQEESKMPSSSSSSSKSVPHIEGRSSLPASVVKPSMLPSELESPDLIQFYSIESALFSAPASAALGRYQQQMLQLPAAIKANQAAMAEAESKGELGEIGALYIESKRLKTELKRMQTEIPPDADVIEVRDTISLPYGLVPLEKNIYYLMRKSEKDAWMGERKLIVSQIHPKGQFKPGPFGDPQLGLGRVQMPDSKIFQHHLHSRGFSQACSRQRVQVKDLVYRGSRDGFSGAAYHSKVDSLNCPTLTLVRTKESRHVFIVYIAEGLTSSTGQFATDAFICCFGPEAKPLLTKLECKDKTNAVYQQPGYGLYLGTSGYALNFSANFDSSHNSTWRAADTVFKCAPGFDGQTWGNTTLAGSPTFLVDEMEVYALAAKINHTSDHAHATSTSTPARAVYNRGKGGKRLGPSPVAQRVMKTAPSRYAEEFSDYSD